MRLPRVDLTLLRCPEQEPGAGTSPGPSCPARSSSQEPPQLFQQSGILLLPLPGAHSAPSKLQQRRAELISTTGQGPEIPEIGGSFSPLPLPLLPMGFGGNAARTELSNSWERHHSHTPLCCSRAKQLCNSISPSPSLERAGSVLDSPGYPSLSTALTQLLQGLWDSPGCVSSIS